MKMRSSGYWRRREEEALQHYITEEEEYDRQIQQIYKTMLDNIQSEIDAFYGRYATKEGITLQEAKKRVSEADIEAYARKAKEYVARKDLSDIANEEMRLYNLKMKVNRLEMLKARIGMEVTAGTDEMDKHMGAVLKKRVYDELKRQAGILGHTVVNNEKLAHEIPNASFHGATFSERLWRQDKQMMEDLSRLLQSGLIRGKNPRVLAREIRRYFIGDTRLKNSGGVIFNAERLMRTELARVQTAAQKASFEANGFTQYEYIANSRCCEACQALDGKHFDVADMMPGENAAPLHPNCRCSVAAYDDGEEYQRWLKEVEAEERGNRRAHKHIAYHTYADPMREIMGSGLKSHPKEVAEFLAALAMKSVEIEYRDEAMAYQPSPVRGTPGKLVIDPEASYSAWLHEMQHVSDDEASGWRAVEKLFDDDAFNEMESRAYDVEIEFATKLGYTDIVNRLRQLKENALRK